MREKDGCAQALMALLFIPVLRVISVVASGYALTVLWGWFVIPTFGAPALSLPAAYGLSMIVSFMTYQETKSVATSDDSSIWMTLLKGFFMAIFRPAFALLFGWLVHLFM